nr:immunoglobulin light chain junction region [Macaca mulatta]
DYFCLLFHGGPNWVF